METIYVRTGKEEWEKNDKVLDDPVRGLILLLEWLQGLFWNLNSEPTGQTVFLVCRDIFRSTSGYRVYSHFFLESTFVAVMFRMEQSWKNSISHRPGWSGMSANLSALWILVANAWMQNPVGMTFNPEAAERDD